MSKLIVYYSRSGSSAQAAKALREILSCDIEEMVSKYHYKGLIGTLRAGYRASRGKTSEIEEPKKDPKKYDLVIMVTPVWDNSITPPIREYLAQNKGLKKIALVSVSGGGGSKKISSNFTEAAGVEPIASIQFSNKDVTSGSCKERLEKFAKSL